MNREFFFNIGLLVLINLLIKPFYIFGIDRTVQNLVPEGDYGLYFALFNFSFLFYMISDFGIQYFNSHHLAQHRHLLQKYLPAFLSLKFLLSIGYLIVVFIIGILSGYDSRHFPLLLLLTFVQLLNSLVLFLRSNLSGIGRYRTDSLVSALDRLLLIFICGALLWTPSWRSQFQIAWFAWAQISSLSMTAIIVFVIIRRHAGPLTFRFRPALLRLIIRYSTPFALAVFLMTAYTRMDGIMLERLLPDGQIESDYYASAFRLLDAGNMIGFLFAGLLLPMFSSLAQKSVPLLSLLRFSFQLIWAFAIPLAIGTIFYRQEIMVLLYENGGKYSGDILGLLMLTFIAMSTGYIFSTLLTALGKLRKMNYIFLGGFLINLALNLLLIPQYKATGAAFATCLTQFGIVLAHLVLMRQELTLPTNYSLLIRISIYVAIIFAFNLILANWQNSNWGVKYILGLVLSLFPAFGLQLIDLKALLRFLSPGHKEIHKDI